MQVTTLTSSSHDTNVVLYTAIILFSYYRNVEHNITCIARNDTVSWELSDNLSMQILPCRLNRETL